MANGKLSVLLSAAVMGYAFGAAATAAESEPEIKALTPEQVEGYLDGRGMGFARAAELNGYPGPAHVLELADQLELSPAQREQTETLYRAMQSDARALGVQLVEAERRLDRLFAQGLARRETITPVLDRIASLQGSLRALHLETHLAQATLLEPGQVDRYNHLRAQARMHAGGPGHHHGGAHGVAP